MKHLKNNERYEFSIEPSLDQIEIKLIDIQLIKWKTNN